MGTQPVVLLVTCSALPDGEEWTGTTHLTDAFAARGIDARWVVWDDPDVDWSEGLVAVRSTWDYEKRREEFLAWARSVPRILNSAEVFAWNTDKAYLTELAATEVPVVPTLVVEGEEELPAALAEVADGPGGSAVVKPRVGGGGRGVVVFDWTDGGPADLDESVLGPGPWVVQPLVESVRTEGETSVFVFGGEVASQVRKLPGGGEIRVHEEYGGRSDLVDVTEEAASFARRAVVVAERLRGVALPYARVDVMRDAAGGLVLGELELTEPGLYIDIAPVNAPAFARMVGRTIKEGRSESQ